MKDRGLVVRSAHYDPRRVEHIVHRHFTEQHSESILLAVARPVMLISGNGPRPAPIRCNHSTSWIAEFLNSCHLPHDKSRRIRDKVLNNNSQ
jgi:hypothetical protein